MNGNGNVELHHTAYVVEDLDRAIAQWRQSLGAEIELPPTRVSAHKVRVCFLATGAGRIELIQPEAPDAATGSHSRADGHPDHVCFLCEDFEDRVRRARDEGGIVARPPAPSEAFGGRAMCFVLYRDMGLVEWVER